MYFRPNYFVIPSSLFKLQKCFKFKQFLSFFYNLFYSISILSIFSQVPELWSVNPRKLSYKPLTGSSVSSNLLRVNNIECNQKCKLEILSNGQGNGILYWYKIGFNKDKIYDTFASMHYNCACFLLEKRNIVTSGEICELKVKIHNGLMKIYQ